MDTITTRTNYLNKELTNNIAEYDLGSFTMDDFNFGREQFLVVKAIDVARPDILSFRAYNTQNYWWFLMWYNGIMDIWNDLAEGVVLKYPSIEHVRMFLRTRAKKVKDNRNNKQE